MKAAGAASIDDQQPPKQPSWDAWSGEPAQPTPGYGPEFALGDYASAPVPPRQPPYPPYPPYPPNPSQPLYAPGYPPQYPPQVVYVQAPSRPIPWGYVVVLLAAAIVLIAIFVLPFVSAGFESISGIQLLTQYGSNDLWITIGVAGAVFFIALVCLITPQKGRAAAALFGVVIGLFALAAAYPLYEVYSALSSKVTTDPITGAATVSSYTQYLSGGFWLAVVGVACMLIGGFAVAAGS